MKATLMYKTSNSNSTDSITYGYNGSSEPDLIYNDAELICGRIAGVCKSQSGRAPFEEKDLEKVAKRYQYCIDNGHVSIDEHYNITMLFEDITRFQCLILNSVQIYSTSEKSGRYVTMCGDTAESTTLFSKWFTIFEKLYKEGTPECPAIPVSQLQTRVNETARYVVSLFTKTNICYTANLRQWVSLMLMLRNLSESVHTMIHDGKSVNAQILSDITNLYESLVYYFGDVASIDVTNCQDMFVGLSNGNHIMSGHQVKHDIIADNYCISYETSLATLAQLQRHRALKYFIMSDFTEGRYFVPKVLWGTPYEKEWLSDLNKQKDSIPLATLVNVAEMGFVGDFLSKCSHRLCREVMYETYDQVRGTLDKLHDFTSQSVFSDGIQNAIKKYYNINGSFKGHCSMCKKPCALAKKV